MRLDVFDYEIEFVNGKENIADPSSRLYEGTDDAFNDGEAPGEIAMITSGEMCELSFDDNYMPPLEISQHTAHDGELSRVVSALETDEWDADLEPFRLIKDELTVHKGMLLRAGRAVLPELLRPKALLLAHRGHPGMSRMKSILRERVWWTGMSKHVEDWVGSCRACTLNARREPPTPLTRAELPDTPWDLVAIDFCGPYAMFGGIYVLSLIDYYSRYLIATPVKSTDFATTSKCLSDIFDRFGMPASIKSDNGPPFNSMEYRKFCSDRGIEASFAWPLCPQNNGLAERSMQIGKAMRSAAAEDGNFKRALAEAVIANNEAANRSSRTELPELELPGERAERPKRLVSRPAYLRENVSMVEKHVIGG